VGDIRTGTAAGRWLITAAVLGSGVAFLDGSVVNVALPRMAASLSAGFSTMQWVLDGYLLTLGAFVLVGGAVGDLIGRRAVFLTGLVAFGVTSATCALAQTGASLAVSRAVQGVAAALLIPGSLALITALFADSDRDRAIGAWSGLAGLASAAGPFIGGWLVQTAGWRWIFLINVPLVAVAVVVTWRHVPESHAELPGTVTCHRWRDLDVTGALLAALALGLLVLPLIEHAMATPWRVACFVGAVLAAVAFVVVEQRSARPMVPLATLRSRVFGAANLITFVVYGALGGGMFLLAVQLQTSLHYSPLEAGAALVPLTVMLLLFSARVGALLPTLGARLLLTAGPIIAGIGLALFARAVPGASYLTGVLPGVLVFGAGMCLVVAPITSTALGALPREHAGLASGVNNAVARIAGLIAVATLPVIAGVGAGRTLPVDGFRTAMLVSGVVTAAGGVVAFVMLPRRPDHALAPDTVTA
jgi:EmrB/QacA subfamily drug resistance transporter